MTLIHLAVINAPDRCCAFQTGTAQGSREKPQRVTE